MEPFGHGWNIAGRPDGVKPSGGSISYANSFVNTDDPTITFDEGDDAESGLAAWRIIREEATLTGGTCNAYGNPTVIGAASNPGKPTDRIP